MTGDLRKPPVVTGSGDSRHWLKLNASVPFVEIRAMKKILFLTDALKINGRSVDFAAYICKLSKSSLTGVFLQHEAHSQRAAAAIRDEIACNGITVNEERPLHELEQECRQHNARRFGTICENLGIRSEVIEIAERQAENILLECRYADLLLIDPSLAMGESAVVLPASFLHTILSQSECPVMMIPERFDNVDEIIFAYDGSPSSVFAIKQFASLFPGLADRTVFVVTARGDKRISANEMQKMRNWLNTHYPSVTFYDIQGDSRIGLLEYVLGKDNIIMVMGAYGRSGWSAFFSASHADPLVKYISKALFISHL